MITDMWYGNKIEDVTKIDIFFSDLDCLYRGNIYINDKCVGDYTAEDTQEIEKKFPQLKFNWD